MKLTRFQNLKRSIESLDPNLMRKKLQHLAELLQGHGIPLSSATTAITHEGIFYIDPDSGVAAKVAAYVCESSTTPPKGARRGRLLDGYTDPATVKSLGCYHLMRCNTLAEAFRGSKSENYRVAKRLDGTFFYRIMENDPSGQPTGRVYREIDNQRLQVCQYCMWKVSALLVDTPKLSVEDFDPQIFFDVNQMQAWNSQGKLAKDHGFTKNMYPEDWEEICRIRKAQVQHQCERCFIDLSSQRLQRFLHVFPMDHVENQEGFVKLECMCVSCLARVPGYSHLKKKPELADFNRQVTPAPTDGR